MSELEKYINILKSTKRHIKAFDKIGTDEFIIEAEKSYVYGQYELAFVICKIILNSDNNCYSSRVFARAYELECLIVYYHENKLYDRFNGCKETAFSLLSSLDSKNYDIYDSRYILGKMYAERGRYEEAIRSFEMWKSERDSQTGLAALVEMYKRDQYENDKQFSKLFLYYFLYYQNYDIEDVLLKSAKCVEEYFPQYIHESICQSYGFQMKQLPKLNYTDEDFALPYSLRHFDCANYIRLYVRQNDSPSLSGCMQFLAKQEVQYDIEQRTIQARQRELNDALLRNQINNEKARVDIMRREAEENEKRYKQLKREMENYNSQMREYQEKSLKNQKESLREQQRIKSEVDSIRRTVNFNRFFR